MSNLSDEVIARLLKDMADTIHAVALSATFERRQGCWQTITVRHAALMSDSQDGWDVTFSQTEL